MSMDPKQPKDYILSDLQDGVRVGLLSLCAINSKNGTMNGWGHIDTQAVFTNFTEIRFPCDPESTSTSAEDALLSGCKNQNEGCWGTSSASSIWHHLPTPELQLHQRDISENGRKRHFPNERETKRLPNQAPLLQGPLQGQRSTEPTLPDLHHFSPTFLWTVSWTVVSTLCIAAELPTAALARAWGPDICTQSQRMRLAYL